MNKMPLVTVLVPSYNHSKYIKKRIETIINQTYKNIELFVIDDSSSDDTDRILKEILASYSFRYFCNKKNSGTPFSSWEKLLKIANGKYIWICESDDYAAPNFLETGIKTLEKEEQRVLFYCNSYVIDEKDTIIDHTKSYFHDIWKESRWDSTFVSNGIDELVGYQIRGQVVPNMSSAIINASAFKKAYRSVLKRFHLTGDWLFIGYLLKYGKVVFCKKTLNFYRKHDITSRNRVKSARSQAEFIVTKYLLYKGSKVKKSNFTNIIRSDAIRFLYEPATCFSVCREISSISIKYLISIASLLFYSLLFNKHYLKAFIERYRHANL